ncbi:MAG: type II toxin-antitoxin system PemK/MazF family toxin [Oscillospiraceae bacterium]
MEKGEVYYANLNPIVGSEQGGYRPVVIIQNDIGNLNSGTVIVAAVTSAHHHKHKMPTHVMTTHVEVKNVNKSGLSSRSIVMLEQIRTIDKLRLDKYMGKLSTIDMDKINQAIMVSFGLNPSRTKK